ncbi:hypothetical protein J1N35_032158 [Gossypium stocksii]|uniref:Uncharacterized protein n=1 Tax=Gossypium stocksii TaxID=47602 RepID=A0A9D3V2S3_9ROSI|nr:hypothetical protein J1N35_032158 [Gossypium stocksii]
MPTRPDGEEKRIDGQWRRWDGAERRQQASVAASEDPRCAAPRVYFSDLSDGFSLG